MISRAADLEDETMSTFLVREAVSAAKRRILEDEGVKLTQKDRVALVKALSRPPAPNSALRAAYRKYRQESP
jgi:uncharacterized protein (DUF1778 family)